MLAPRGLAAERKFHGVVQEPTMSRCAEPSLTTNEARLGHDSDELTWRTLNRCYSWMLARGDNQREISARLRQKRTCVGEMNCKLPWSQVSDFTSWAGRSATDPISAVRI